MTDLKVDTADLSCLSQVFATCGADAAALSSAFRAGAGRLTQGDALGQPDVVAQYRQAFDQWSSGLDDIATSMDRLARALALARDLYELSERDATVSTP